MSLLPRPHLLLVLAGACMAPIALAAQAPNPALVAFQDSLGAVSSADLATASVSAAQAARSRTDNALSRSREGLALLRAGQLETGRARLDQALATLDEAIYRFPRSPLPWYVMGLVKLEMDHRGVTIKASMHQADGETWHHGALVAFARSLTNDSSYAPSASALADLLVGAGDVELDPAIQHAVRNAILAHAGADPYLAVARLQRALHHPDSMLISLEQYVRAGGDSGIAGLESARALDAVGRSDSSRVMYAWGAAHMGTEGRRLYRADVGWIATPAELASFDSTATSNMAEWINDFWRRRDVIALRAEGQRLAEHLRRWNYVHEHFRIVGRQESAQFTDGPGGTGPAADPALVGISDVGNDLGVMGMINPDAQSLIEGGRRVLDDRGVIYMRHGEPDDRASWGGGSANLKESGCVTANESWEYNLPTGSLLLHFCSSRRLGSTAATTLVAMLPLYREMIESRGPLDNRYQRLATQLQGLEMRQHLNAMSAAAQRQLAQLGASASESSNPSPAPVDLTGVISPQLVQTMRETGQRQMTTALSTDTYVQRYESSLKPVVQLYAVGTPDGADARLLVIFAIPGDRLTAVRRPDVDGVIYPVSVRTIAVGAKGLDVLRRDTTRYFRVADTLKSGTYLNGMMELPMPAGTHDIRVLFTEPGSRSAAAAGRDAMTLGKPGALALSDLVAGREGAGLTWQHGGEALPLNPLDVYPRTGSMDLYYDVSGMVPGHHYRTSIEIVNTLAAVAGDQARISFDDHATAPAQHVRRTLDLRTLKGGQYRLVLTIEDVEGGTKVSRDRTVNVRE